jgi:hypothetical protein
MRYTTEQTERANATSIIALLREMGYSNSIEQVGRNGEYKGHGFGGLQINDTTGQFHCFSNPDLKGVGAVNFLMKFANVRFLDAMEKLGEYKDNDTYYRPHTQIQKPVAEKKEFIAPEHAENNKRVYAYLCKSRGISSDVVHTLIHAGLLYQDKKGNAVFLNMDKDKAIGAHVCGTMTDVRFKQNLGTGSFQFVGESSVNLHAYVFESPIDMMSFMSLHSDRISTSNFISMSGLKPNQIVEIAQQNPDLKFCFCVDNDEAGKNFVEGMSKHIDSEKVYTSRELETANVKDYNDLLKIHNLEIKSNEKESTDIER